MSWRQIKIMLALVMAMRLFADQIIMASHPWLTGLVATWLVCYSVTRLDRSGL